MTDPLIDRMEIARVVYRTKDTGQEVGSAVLAYLMSVLTPEELWTDDTYDSDGHQLHRRIFGEDA